MTRNGAAARAAPFSSVPEGRALLPQTGKTMAATHMARIQQVYGLRMAFGPTGAQAGDPQGVLPCLRCGGVNLAFWIRNKQKRLLRVADSR